MKGTKKKFVSYSDETVSLPFTFDGIKFSQEEALKLFWKKDCISNILILR